jgi:hypothetical protein
MVDTNRTESIPASACAARKKEVSKLFGSNQKNRERMFDVHRLTGGFSQANLLVR